MTTPTPNVPVSENVTHDLKTWPEYFEKIKSGEKTFEVRKKDRDYKVGDNLLLCEFQPLGYNPVSPNTMTGYFTGRSLEVTITYILEESKEFHTQFNPPGSIVMGIKLQPPPASSALRDALEKIAKQRTYEECMADEENEGGDFEGAYSHIILIARKALAEYKNNQHE